MQLKKTTLICAAAFAAMAAGSANAALTGTLKTTVDNANANGRVLYISGASAVQKGFETIITQMFATTPTFFSIASADGSSFDKANYVAVAGTMVTDAALGGWSGQNAIIAYRVKGGSVWGVNPVAGTVAAGDSIESIDVNSTGCGTSGAGTAASPYSCLAGSAIPDAGVSDVAPKHFVNPKNTEGEVAAPELTEDQRARLTSTALYGLAFGIPVTKNVPATAVFNRATLSSIMAGGIGTWDKVKNSATTGDIVICRRVPGSGTQAVMNMWANNLSCPGNSQSPADRYDSPAFHAGVNYPTNPHTYTVVPNTGSYIVIENSSSADVRTCLDKAVTGGTYATSDRDGKPVTVNFTAAGNKAIGVLSMDSLDKSKSSGNWQFRSLDGAGTMVWDNTSGNVSTSGSGKFPTLDTYESGDWDLQGWISFNVPARTTGDKADVLTYFLNKAQDPAVLAGVSALKNVAAAIPGTYAGSQVLDAEYLGGDQCAPYSRNYND